MYNIEKPFIKDGKWIVFPNTTVSDIDTMDCNDTMAGECYNNKSFKECVRTCEKSPECNFGYFISNTDDINGKDICVPLRDRNVNSNPIYRLRKQSIYPELKGTTSTVFVNKNKYPFPPEQANNVFYMDNFLIKNIETDIFLENSHTPIFEKNGSLIVQPLQVPPDLSSGPQYVTVNYGDLLIFNIPNTVLIMAYNNKNKEMDWISRSVSISQDMAYTIVPTMKGKKIGDNVLYSDEFSIQMGDNVFGVKDKKIKIQRKKENATFKFIPKMKGWYCNNDSECTEIPLEKMIVGKDGIGKYDGLAIGRNEGCFGVCKYKVSNQPYLKPLDIYQDQKKGINILLFILSPIIIFFVIIFFVNRLL